MFAVTYSYNDDVATRDRVRPEHREYLSSLTEREHLVVAGGFGPDRPAGALLLFRAQDEAQVRRFVADDPFSTAGVIASAEVASWTPALGVALPAFTD
ncbi:MAG TPA: YciI family protein [Mycobacterium sp.]|nr:YciI family protein [Mycobacterium sp.]